MTRSGPCFCIRYLLKHRILSFLEFMARQKAFTRFSSDTTTGSVGVRPTGEEGDEGEVDSWDGKQTKSNSEAARTRPEMSRIMVGCSNSFNNNFLRKVIDENETILLTGAFLDCLDRDRLS